MKGAAPFVWALLAIPLLWLALRRFERSMIFVPDAVMRAHPGVAGLKYEAIWLTGSDGTRLRAWWLPGPKDDSPVMLCLHGNGGNLSYRVDKMRIFHDAGAAQLWLDWRGYGESAGTPSERGLHRDAQAGWDWLKAKGVPPARLVIYGESLGCGPAIELAAKAAPAGLVVDSGFTSVADMAKRVLPWFPMRLASVQFDNLTRVRSVYAPALFLHSPQDDIIPFEMGRRNFEACPAQRKRFVELKGDHNEGFLTSMPGYRDAIAGFLKDLQSASTPR